MLPYLRAYMGHEKFSDTAYYIHILPERLMVSPGVQWDTVGRNKKVIAEYIRNQLAEDKISDQISIKEYFDPFTGEQVNKSK